MKAIIEKINHTEDHSYHCEIVSLPYFTSTWHFHDEFEINMVIEGNGTAFVGDNSISFRPGSFFLFGEKLPHVLLNSEEFYKPESQLKATSIVIRFHYDFLGLNFMEKPEMSVIRRLLETSSRGIMFQMENSGQVKKLLDDISKSTDFSRILNILKILDLLTKFNQFKLVSSKGYISKNTTEDCNRIDKVYRYVMNNISEKIELDQVAKLANLSPPSFCRYFKSRTNKTFSQFLNEIRVGYACRLLIEKDMDSSETCYASGFNSLSNFHKQFRRIKGLTPYEYRDKHMKTVEN